MADDYGGVNYHLNEFRSKSERKNGSRKGVKTNKQKHRIKLEIVLNWVIGS